MLFAVLLAAAPWIVTVVVCVMVCVDSPPENVAEPEPEVVVSVSVTEAELSPEMVTT